MVTEKLSWKFPGRDKFLHRIEGTFVSILALLIFIGSFTYYSYELLFPILITALFLVTYIFSAHLIKIIRNAQEHYLAHPSHLEIRRKSRNKSSKVKVPWKKVHRHKLDHFFLGGYLLTKDKKRHPLFFNTKNELQKFEKFAKKHMKKG
jgi:hypothetical protein